MVQETRYKIQDTKYNAQYTVHTQYTRYKLPNTKDDAPYTIHNSQYTRYKMQCINCIQRAHKIYTKHNTQMYDTRIHKNIDACPMHRDSRLNIPWWGVSTLSRSRSCHHPVYLKHPPQQWEGPSEKEFRDSATREAVFSAVAKELNLDLSAQLPQIIGARLPKVDLSMNKNGFRGSEGKGLTYESRHPDGDGTRLVGNYTPQTLGRRDMDPTPASSIMWERRVSAVMPAHAYSGTGTVKDPAKEGGRGEERVWGWKRQCLCLSRDSHTRPLRMHACACVYVVYVVASTVLTVSAYFFFYFDFFFFYQECL